MVYYANYILINFRNVCMALFTVEPLSLCNHIVISSEVIVGTIGDDDDGAIESHSESHCRCRSWHIIAYVHGFL